MTICTLFTVTPSDTEMWGDSHAPPTDSVGAYLCVGTTPDAGITTGATTTAGVAGCTVGTTADAATGAGEVAGAFALTDAATMLLAFTRAWATDAAAWASGVVGAGLLTAGGTGLPVRSA